MNNIQINNYEMTSIIGARAEQLAKGAKPNTDIGNLTDPILIAQKEFNEGTIPICIKRMLPNGLSMIVEINSR